MKSVVDRYWTIIDRRQLIFQGCFFELSGTKMENLLQDFYQFFNSLIWEEYVVSWQVNDRSGGKDKSKIKINYDKSGHSFITVSACYKSDFMKYKMDLKNYIQYMNYPPFGHNLDNNYDEYYHKELIPFSEDPDQLKEAILRVYNDTGKYLIAQYRECDFDGYISSYPRTYEDCDMNIRYGEFSFAFSLYSLDGKENELSHELMKFGEKILLEYEKINISVGIDTGEKSYARVFSSPSHKLEFEDRNLKRFTDHICLSSISWGNLISKYTLRLSDCQMESPNEDVNVIYLETGGCIVQCSKSVKNTDISELRIIKSLLYPYILPGDSIYPKDWKHRKLFEMVPVFENEVYAEEKGIRLCHASNLDVNILKQLYLECSEAPL